MLRRLELTVRRRLDGLLQGNHLGLVPGPGSEARGGPGVPPGDDVRRMDWAVTARTTVPHVRQTDRRPGAGDLAGRRPVAQPRLRHRRAARSATWRSPRSAAVGHLTGARRQPDRRAAHHRREAAPVPGPVRPGAHHRAAAQRWPLDAALRQPAAGRGDLAAALEALRRPPRRRGFAVVVSDFLGDLPSRLGAADAGAGRPRTTCSRSRCSTRVELELPSVGLLTARRPGDRQAAGGADRREASCGSSTRRPPPSSGPRSPRRCAGPAPRHLQLRTDRDWLLDMVRFVAARRARRRPEERCGDPYLPRARLAVAAARGRRAAGGLRPAAAAPPGVRGPLRQPGPARQAGPAPARLAPAPGLRAAAARARAR